MHHRGQPAALYFREIEILLVSWSFFNELLTRR